MRIILVISFFSILLTRNVCFCQDILEPLVIDYNNKIYYFEN